MNSLRQPERSNHPEQGKALASDGESLHSLDIGRELDLRAHDAEAEGGSDPHLHSKNSPIKSSEGELFLPMMDILVVTNNTNDLLSSDLLTEQIQISGFNCNCLIHSQACGSCISQKI